MYARQTKISLDEILYNANIHYLGEVFYVEINGKMYRAVKGSLNNGINYFNHPLYNSKYEQAAAYVLQHWIDGKLYIGSSGNIYTRISSHKSGIRTKNHRNKNLNELLESTDIDHFDLILLFTITRDEAYDIEQFLLDKYKNNSLLLNSAEDARIAGLGNIHSDQTKKFLSDFHKTDEKAIAQLRNILDSKRRRINKYENNL